MILNIISEQHITRQFLLSTMEEQDMEVWAAWAKVPNFMTSMNFVSNKNILVETYKLPHHINYEKRRAKSGSQLQINNPQHASRTGALNAVINFRHGTTDGAAGICPAGVDSRFNYIIYSSWCVYVPSQLLHMCIRRNVNYFRGWHMGRVVAKY